MSSFASKKASINIDLPDIIIEIKGPASVMQRNVQRLLASAVMSVALLGLSAPTHASDITNKLQSKNISQIELRGHASDRYSEKAIGLPHKSTNYRSLSPPNKSPALAVQSSHEIYSASRLAKEYAKMGGVIEKIKHNLSGIVNTDNIYFFGSIDAAALGGHDVSQLAAIGMRAEIAGKQAGSDFPVCVNQLIQGSAISETLIIATNYNDAKLQNYTKGGLYDQLKADPDTTNLFIAKHEAAHAFLNNARNGLDVMSLVEESVDLRANANHLSSDSKEAILLVARADETIKLVGESGADIFSLLSIQKDYYLENKLRITSGEMSLLSPLFEHLYLARSPESPGGVYELTHDTRIAIKKTVAQLKEPGAMDSLSTAGDAEILSAAYGIISQSYHEITEQTGLSAYGVAALPNFSVLTGVRSLFFDGAGGDIAAQAGDLDVRAMSSRM